MSQTKRFESRNPKTDDDGNEYPYMMLSLSISQHVVGTDIRESVAMKFKPYRIDAVTGEIVVHDSKMTVVTGDAGDAVTKHPRLAALLSSIMRAVETHANQKEF